MPDPFDGLNVDPVAAAQFMRGLPPVLPSLSKPQPQQQVGMNAAPAMPATALPPVTAPIPSPEERRAGDMRSRLQKLESTPSATEGLWKKAGEYHQEHPGVIGRLGQVGAGILRGVDIGGEILAPNIARNIPGSILNRAQNLAGAKADLGAAEKQSQEAAQAESERATAAKTRKETELLGQPKPAEESWTVDNSLRGPSGEPVEVEKTSGQMRVAGKTEGITVYDKESGAQVKTSFQDLMKPDKKLHKVLVNAQTGQEIRDLGETKQPGAGGDKGTTVVLPSGQVVRATPGSTIPAGAQTISGWAEQGRPTTQMRNSAGRAAIVHEQMPYVISEVNRLKDQLGPIAGRWNEFMQGKVGMDNADFAGLRSDLVMAASAVALAHAMGRLPENLREEFDKMIDAPQQTPENIIATLQHIDPWMQKMAEMGQGPGNVPQGQPAVGTVEDGYRFKGGDPSKQESWEKVGK